MWLTLLVLPGLVGLGVFLCIFLDSFLSNLLGDGVSGTQIVLVVATFASLLDKDGSFFCGDCHGKTMLNEVKNSAKYCYNFYLLCW